MEKIYGENLYESIASYLRNGIVFLTMVAILSRFFEIYGIQLTQPVTVVKSFIIFVPMILNF